MELNPQLFYNLKDSPNQSEFLGIFNFYKETLKLNKDYGVKAAHLFFVNSFSMNARTGLSDNVNVQT